MKTLLYLNGPKGCQMGIEDGFRHLKEAKKLDKLLWFYYQDYAEKQDIVKAQYKMVEIAKNFQPQIIVFFHIGNFSINDNFFTSLKKLDSKPILVYDEGDMYGGWAKPLSPSIKIAIKNSDVVSIRGLGKWFNTVSKLNKTIIYTPHSNSLYRYSQKIEIAKERRKDVIFTGNKVRSKLGNIRRLPGANKRERIVEWLSNHLKNKFSVYGIGWDNLPSNKGVLEFTKQVEVYNKYWFHLSIEHYPNIPYYFSDRLPIALSSGQIYICHFHEGYQSMFANSDFIYFFKNEHEAMDIIHYLKTLNNEQLVEKSKNAKRWAEENLSPLIVWSNFYEIILRHINHRQ